MSAATSKRKTHFVNILFPKFYVIKHGKFPIFRTRKTTGTVIINVYQGRYFAGERAKFECKHVEGRGAKFECSNLEIKKKNTFCRSTSFFENFAACAADLYQPYKLPFILNTTDRA